MLKFIKKMIAAALAIIFFVGLDRFLKVLALAEPGRQIDLIGSIFKYKFAANYYIAFSLPFYGRLLIAVIGLIILILISLAVYYFKKQADDNLLPLLLIILGASSNLFDRLRYGFVVDYFDLKYFTVFNLADAMIVAGVILLIFFSYKKEAK